STNTTAIALCAKVPRSGTVKRLGVRINTCATAATATLGAETLDGSGNPTGTAYGGGSITDTFTPAATTPFEVTLSTPFAATVGDALGLVVRWQSSAGDMFVTANGNTALAVNKPYLSGLISSVWTKQSAVTIGTGCFWMGYDDGSGGIVYPR